MKMECYVTFGLELSSASEGKNIVWKIEIIDCGWDTQTLGILKATIIRASVIQGVVKWISMNKVKEEDWLFEIWTLLFLYPMDYGSMNIVPTEILTFSNHSLANTYY